MIPTVHDQIDLLIVDLLEELARARRHQDSLLRAEREGRMTNEPELQASIRKAAAKVRALEVELADACARQAAMEEA